MEVTVKNVSDHPAMLVRLNVAATDGDQIQPVSYSDNHVYLLPGESRKVAVEWKTPDQRSDAAPKVTITSL